MKVKVLKQKNPAFIPVQVTTDYISVIYEVPVLEAESLADQLETALRKATSDANLKTETPRTKASWSLCAMWAGAAGNEVDGREVQDEE